MKSLKIKKATLTLVAFVLTMGTFVFSADSGKENGKSPILAQQTDPQKKELSEDPAYLAWKAKYDDNKQKFDKSKKTIRIGMITTGAGLLIEIGSAIFLASTVDEYGTVKSGGAAGYVIGALTAAVGSGIWIYGAIKRHSAKEEMEVLMDEGRIKRYISPYSPY